MALGKYFSRLMGRIYTKSKVPLGGISGSKRARIWISQIKTMLVTSFDIKGFVHFEFTKPNTQPVSLCGNGEAVT
jgi:hypothetical protein